MNTTRRLYRPLAALLVGGALVGGGMAGGVVSASARPAAPLDTMATVTTAPSSTATTAPSSTSTIAPSSTATTAPTATGTATALPSATASATASPSATATGTAMPSATSTMTSTSTATTTPMPSATATITPVVRATLAVTPTLINRGGLVTVSGAGFLPHETVLIFFNGAPRIVTPRAADATGNLAATGLSVPYSLSVGSPHTLTAIGARSRRVARASIVVQALTPSITLSATTAQPGTAITVTGSGFSAQERVTLALDGVALHTTPTVITTTNGAFTAAFSAPRFLLNGANTVSAVGNLSRVTAVSPLTGSLPVATRFYFAGGLNGPTAHSSLDLLNPYGEPTDAQLTVYLGNGATFSRSLSVGPRAERSVDMGGLGLPYGSFGLSVSVNRPIAAQLNLTRDGQDGDNLLGNTELSTTWYLAEGYTGLSFHESVSILNPDPVVPAVVQLRLLPLGGGPTKVVTVTVAPHSDVVTDINSQLPGQSVSIVASSTTPVAVERTLTFSTNGFGMTARTGTNTPATSWIFAEGTTVNRFQTFLTVLNPNALPVHVTASFFDRSGQSLGSRTITVLGQSRGNFKENDYFNASGVAAVVTGDEPVVVERPEYFGSPNGANIAGSDVFGQNGAGVRWSFPGGNITPGISEFLLIYNPSAVTIPIDATFYGADGTHRTVQVSVPPTVRYNIDVSQLVPGFAPIHGAVLRSLNGQGFVAEQTVFANNYTMLRSTQGLAQ